jgi:hypothetical protein
VLTGEGKKPVQITGIRLITLHMFLSISVVQINPFRPPPSHSANDSQFSTFDVKIFSRSALAGRPKQILHLCLNPLSAAVSMFRAVSEVSVYSSHRSIVSYNNIHICGSPMGRDSSVGIATRYGLDGPGIESRCWRHFPHPSRLALGPTQPPIQWVPGLSRRKMRLGRGVDHPHHLALRSKKE